MRTEISRSDEINGISFRLFLRRFATPPQKTPLVAPAVKPGVCVCVSLSHARSPAPRPPRDPLALPSLPPRPSASLEAVSRRPLPLHQSLSGSGQRVQKLWRGRGRQAALPWGEPGGKIKAVRKTSKHGGWQ